MNRSQLPGVMELPPVAGHFGAPPGGRTSPLRARFVSDNGTARWEGVLLGGKRPRRKFSDEFKRDAVEIVRSSGKPIRQVANELSIYDSTLFPHRRR